MESLFWQTDKAMAEYQEDNTYDFNLSFQSRWNPPESKLLRKGRKKDPLCKKLRVSKVTNKYEENMSHGIQPDEENKYTYDFALDKNGIIVPGMSTGLSTYTSENRLAQDLKYERTELWKLLTVEKDKPIKYPTEMELSPIRGCSDHLGIKPASTVRVSHQTFLQMLRCLPWTKY